MLHNERTPAVGAARGSRMQARGHELRTQHSAVRLERKLPAYAREVESWLRTGRQPNVFCYAGRRCWERAHIRYVAHGDGTVMVLQEDVPPDRWRWPAGLDAMVLAVEGMEPAAALAIARAAVAGGVRCVVVCGLKSPAVIRRAG